MEQHAVQSVAIVGAGMMGTAIAAANVRRKMRVLLADADARVLAAAPARVADELTAEGLCPSQETAAIVTRLLATTTEMPRLGQSGLVLESIVESIPAKQRLYAELEPHLSPGALLATNTSTIPITRLAARLADPGRFLGLHFFHPVRNRPLVEIVHGLQTAERTVSIAIGYVRAIDKVPLVVHDGPGFLVNRLLMPYLAESLELLLEGVPPAEVESAATCFGMAMGPLRLMDEIGLDTVLRGGRVLWEAFPERITPSPLLVAMYKSGRLGRKVGAGFFVYSTQGSPCSVVEPSPGVNDLIAAWAKPSAPLTPDHIVARLLLPMVLEATRILEARKVDGPGPIDLAVNLGLGFPTSRGGLLRWADSLGPKRITTMLEGMAHLGPRCQPTPFLLEMARGQRGFYSRAA